MQLTRYTDLGLRILMRLAAVDDPAATTRTVAAQMAVSYTHAAKVVARLQALGLVETRRGRTGGLQITDAGRHQSVGRLARELEGPDEVIDCEGLKCPLRKACRLRGLLREAQEAFFVVLDPWTVEELSREPTGSVLLALSVRPPD
ncbi:RrF2 family transcriptional regulator [Nocardioides gilvus]|uniref:RrF2 family transcriptional regulator n=1 Tax=Nocardioides gilvus TaxID=1735589 RepID=UPI000D741DDC|nr:Rrf2 family transcriptional regulator [Nocardioides gilvus]